jgi:hypothetical protein
MTPVLAIISCEHDRKRGCHDAIRDTYLAEAAQRVPYTFVMGSDAKPLYQDEVCAKAGDGYHETYQKNNWIIRQFLKTDCTHLIMGDVDTYFCLPRLLKHDFAKHDYIGRRCDEGHAGGGYGYILSRHAAKILSAHPLNGVPYNDLNLGMILREHGVHVHDRSDIFLDKCPTSWTGHAVSAHLGISTGSWNPRWMRDCHAIFEPTAK